jgi:hypothetical protein
MPRCRVYELEDGSVSVVHPAPNGRRGGEREEAWYARVMERTEAANPNLAGRPFADIDVADLPVDRSERNSWRLRDDPERPGRRKVRVERA